MQAEAASSDWLDVLRGDGMNEASNPPMPKNRYIYSGIVLLVATALLWVGTLLAKLISWILPYTGLAAVVLIMIGVYLEYDRANKSKNRGDKP